MIICIFIHLSFCLFSRATLAPFSLLYLQMEFGESNGHTW